MTENKIGQKTTQPFLKQKKDFYTDFLGQPLDDLISLNSNEMNGLVFTEDKIPGLTQTISTRVLSLKNTKVEIKNSEIVLFLYTLCKVGDSVLFLVWQIKTQISNQSRTSWEEKYGCRPGTCCAKNSILTSLQEAPGNDFNFELFEKQKGDLKLLFEKNCQ